MSHPQEGSNRGLPRRDSSHRPPRRVIVASHIIMMGYGHWFPNDPRGSGSTEVRKVELEGLGPIHLGRKRIQPSRPELRAFFREGEPLLKHETLWWSHREREVIAGAFSEAIQKYGYTVFAFAVMKNHLHFVNRNHRDRDLQVFDNIANAIKSALWNHHLAPREHPVFSGRPYSRFCYTYKDVRRSIAYVEDNPEKEGLPRQSYAFVTPYNH